MIRGWRNDPRWVEFYKKRDEERARREMQRAEIEMQLRLNESRVDQAIKAMQRRPLIKDMTW
jgi:hypothetical protein